MSHQNPLFKKEEVKSPAVVLFMTLYVAAVISSLFLNPLQALVYILMSMGILLLVWFIFGLTEKIKIEQIRVRRPWLELAFGLIFYVIFIYLPFPVFRFGDKWYLSSIVRKELFLFAIPLTFLLLRRNSFISLGLSSSNWGKNVKTGFIVLGCMAIPSLFFISNTGNLIITGRLNIVQVTLGFIILFFHNIALSGLPEEFFYRSFVQTRLSIVLKSKLGGVLMISLIFGLSHVDDLMRWYPDMTLIEALCRAFFVQGFTGLVYGFLWARTNSLIPCIIVHSGLNALNGLGSAASLLKF